MKSESSNLRYLLLFVPVAILAIIGLSSDFGSSSQYIFLFAGVALFVLVGLWYFLRYYATRYLLNMNLQIDNPEVGRGDNLKFKVIINPSSNITLTRLAMKLKCVQTVHDTGQMMGDFFAGRNSSRSILDDMPEVIQEFDGEINSVSLSFQKGKVQEIPAEFPIPEDAIHTKGEGRLQTQWYLRVEAHLPAPDPPAIVEQIVKIVQNYQAHSQSLPQYANLQDTDTPFQPKSSSQQSQSSSLPPSLPQSQGLTGTQNTAQQPAAPFSNLELPPDPPQTQKLGDSGVHLEFEDGENQS